MNSLDQRIAAALRAPSLDRPLPDGLADRVAAAARSHPDAEPASQPRLLRNATPAEPLPASDAASRLCGEAIPHERSETRRGPVPPAAERPGVADRPPPSIASRSDCGLPSSRHSSLVTRHSSLRRTAAAAVLALGLASAAAAAWLGVLRPGLRWGVAGGDRERDLVPGTALPCLVFAVPCAPGTPPDAIEERVLGPLGRLAERNGWRARAAAPALGTLAHGAFRDRGGVLLVPLPERADADAIRALAREKAAALAESFPAFAGAPFVDVRPFSVPSPGFASEAALAFADRVLLEAGAGLPAAESSNTNPTTSQTNSP